MIIVLCCLLVWLIASIFSITFGLFKWILKSALIIAAVGLAVKFLTSIF